MEELELFESGDLKPVSHWLHVWTEAERARRLNKKPAPSGREPMRAEVMRLFPQSGLIHTDDQSRKHSTRVDQGADL